MTLREYIAFIGYDTEQFFADVEILYVQTNDDCTYPTEGLDYYLDNQIHTIANRFYLNKGDPLEKRINTFEVTVYQDPAPL